MEPPVYPPTLWELLARRANRDPDRVIIEDDRDRTLTAGEWLRQSEQVAAALLERGVGQDSIVSWQLPTTMEAAVLLMAVSRLQAVQNPILPILRHREVGFIIAQTRSRLLITPSVWRNFDFGSMAELVSKESGIDTMTLDIGGLPTGDPSTLPSPPTGSGNPVRHIYYSSGSTADPKGALHTDSSAMNSATGTILGYVVGHDDVIPVPFPYTHIGGMALTVAALYTGCRLLLIDIFDPKTSPQLIGKKGGTLLGSAVPFFQAYLEAQLRHGAEPLYPRLRAFSGGGAPKPPELYYEMKKVFGIGIISSWGLTEFPIATSGTYSDSDEELANTEGRPVPRVELRVVGNDEQDLATGQEGELRLKGPQACKGYVDSSLNADAFDPKGFFRTGDLGVVGPRGHVQITGRIKDIIIRNAENISAKEIEDILYTHPKIGEVAVVGVPDPTTGERACAVVVLAEGSEGITMAEIIEHCRSHKLATQKIPERLEVVAELPRNSLGKILKRELRSTFGRGSG